MTEFKHGKRGYWHHRCRCPVCTAANTAAVARYRARRPRRRPGRPEAHPPGLIAHAKQLRKAGWTLPEIRALTGIPTTTLHRHFTGDLRGRKSCKK